MLLLNKALYYYIPLKAVCQETFSDKKILNVSQHKDKNLDKTFSENAEYISRNGI